ncbi:unnamed protein product, partial [Ectocarpus sp. 12 AP-2014]
VLELKEEEQTFTFEDVASEPIPSLLRFCLRYCCLETEYTKGPVRARKAAVQVL